MGSGPTFEDVLRHMSRVFSIFLTTVDLNDDKRIRYEQI